MWMWDHSPSKSEMRTAGQITLKCHKARSRRTQQIKFLRKSSSWELNLPQFWELARCCKSKRDFDSVLGTKIPSPAEGDGPHGTELKRTEALTSPSTSQQETYWHRTSHCHPDRKLLCHFLKIIVFISLLPMFSKLWAIKGVIKCTILKKWSHS